MSQDFEHKNEAQILAYVFGKMSKDEMTLFEKSMDLDLALKEEVLLRKSLYHSFNETSWNAIDGKSNLEEIERLKKNLRSDNFRATSQTIREAEQKYLQKQTAKTSRARYYKLMAVAAAIIFIMVLPIFKKTNGSSIYNDYTNWNELPSLIEKGGTSTNVYTRGEAFYNSGQYNQAISYLKAHLNKNDELYTYGLLYLGAAYFQTNQIENAHQTFSILTQSNSLQSSYGYWYKLLIYLKDNDMIQAQAMLNIIIENPDYYNHERAKLLQKELIKNGL